MKEETILEKHASRPKYSDGYDVTIIGAGPAGMSAAVCAGRAKLKTLLIEKALPGGEASTAYKIENYLGFPDGTLGVDLSKQMEAHVRHLNVDLVYENVEDIQNIQTTEKMIRTELGNLYKTKAIIVATGLEPKKLNTPFEQKFLGRGLSYYAQSDPELYRDKDVAVIGGGNCACYAAEYLSNFVNKLYLVHNTDTLKAVSSLKEKILSTSNVSTMWDSKLVDIFGIDNVEKIKILNTLTGQHTWLDVKGVFIYVGRIPPQQIFNLELNVDENGYIITDEYMRTNIRGVYAAGDIRAKQIRQIATAVSDGMVAAINAERDLR